MSSEISDFICKYQPLRLWLALNAGIILSIDTLRREKPLIKYYIALLVGRKKQITKKLPQIKKKKLLSHQENSTVSQVVISCSLKYASKCYSEIILNEKIEFCMKSVFFLVSFETYWVI